MTITSTNFRSTKVLDNHKPPDYDKSEGDDLDASYSVYTPSLERTMGCNSCTRTNCDAPLCGTSPIPPQLPSLPPSYPESPLYSGSPLLPSASTVSTSWKDDTAVPKEWPSLADISETGVWGPGEEGGVGGLPKAESNQRETTEVLGEGGLPDPGPCGGTSGPSELPDPGSLPAPNKTAVRRNLMRDNS